MYWTGGAFVAVVMTWNSAGVGLASELLAGRVTRCGIRALQPPPGESAEANVASAD